MNDKMIVFAGTTEGRILSEFAKRHQIDSIFCVSTEFGRQLIEEDEHVKVSSKRLGEDGLRDMISQSTVVIDATHPYANVMSHKILDECKAQGKECIRLLRPEGKVEDDGLILVPDIDSAVEYLKGVKGNVLVTTGSKELEAFTRLEDFKERVYGRVLSTPSVAQKCAEFGFEGKNLFCMKGPFCEEMNYGMLKQVDARYMVTKDSGEPGGFEEKIKAARRADAKVILVGRPSEMGRTYCLEEVIEIVKGRYDIADDACMKRTVTIVGVGMGDPSSLTEASKKAIDEADILIGASRMIGPYRKRTLNEYRTEKVLRFLDESPDLKNIAILVSGDTGFQSAAKNIFDSIDRDRFEIKVLPGISSISYLCSRIGQSWDDAHLMSAHGIDANIIGNVVRRKKVISLLEGSESAKRLCEDLIEYGLNVNVTIGQDLGSDKESIVSGKPSDIVDHGFGTLCIALIENENPIGYSPGIDDGEFIRGDAPMTKCEIRALSVSKLNLNEDSIVYDIGAGTGSVSIEMALRSTNGKVFAIEKEGDSVELILKNKRKFKTHNLNVIKGLAPDAMAGLPTPTHAFIGGSSGNMREILGCILEKNKDVRIVINSITLETMSEVLGCIEELGLVEEETISVSVSKAKKVGRFHMMNALNPIFITTLNGKNEN